MPKLKSGLKTYSNDVKINKFNLMGLSLPEIQNSIEYEIFIENGEAMESYTHLHPVVTQLADLVVRYADRAVRQYQTEMTYTLADAIRGDIQQLVLGSRIQTDFDMESQTTVDDEGIVDQRLVKPGTEGIDTKPDKGGHNDW